VDVVKKLSRFIIPIAIGLLTFAALRYLFPSSPAAETAHLECSFAAPEQSALVTNPHSQDRIGRIDYEADLTGKYVDGDLILWHADGVATYQGGSQNLAGAIFLRPTNEVRGFGLYRDRHPHQSDDLRISTLNENGNLDWDDESAFVYFENAPDKMAQQFDYSCTVRQTQSH
tara:strand:- start:171 stop:686 length:516 start_codon:yes stop_codon:yes gene_type:complete